MKKLLLLANIHSGKGIVEEQLPAIINYYNKADYEVTVYISQYSGHIKEIAQTRGSDFDVLVCSGGDGTLNEVVNGIADIDRKPVIGYIPAGSTNDFASSMGIPLNIEDSYKKAVDGEIFNLDIGKINDRHFVYVAAFGLFTNISYETPQNIKNILGYQAYLLEGVRQLTNIKSYRLEIEYDEGIIKDDIMIGLVSNSNSIAGMKTIFRNYADLNDGLFEVLLVKAPKNVNLLRSIVTSIVEKNFDAELFYSFKTSHISIKCDEEINWTIDGEYCGTFNTADINVINKALAIKH